MYAWLNVCMVKSMHGLMYAWFHEINVCMVKWRSITALTKFTIGSRLLPMFTTLVL